MSFWFMKPSDAAVLKRLDDIENILHTHSAAAKRRFDSIDRQLDALILDKEKYVSPELETAVKGVSLRALSIDQKVSDVRLLKAR